MIKKAESRTEPKRLISIGGKTHFTFDIEQTYKDEELHYKYSYVEIDGVVTEEKIKAAILEPELITEETAEKINIKNIMVLSMIRKKYPVEEEIKALRIGSESKDAKEYVDWKNYVTSCISAEAVVVKE